MNILPLTPVSGRALAARPLFKVGVAAILAGFISVSLPVPLGRAQPADQDRDGEEVLTRGPVHEAFAGVVSYNPEPGIIVRRPPPDLIDELPPAERPEGDDIAWIPGYWGWDDEREDYLWISGTWRVLPPGREWMAGYWRDTGGGHQWISGYWADTETQETTYLPPPPLTLEVGANVDAPSRDYGWTPGCWIWFDGRYAWRAGYWSEGRADWVWVPSYYVWTPRGVIFVEGFWDYPVQRRGILFAPVYYHSRGYARRGYSYSPRIVISLSFFGDNLFLRPSYHHYYFGDYYDPRYEEGGFFMSYSYQSSRQGYDPFYSHRRWEHRSERDWGDRYRAAYLYRRDHEAARPPRTWSAQLTVSTRPAAGGQVNVSLATPLEQLVRSRDSSVRFQAVPQGDRQELAGRGRKVQQSRDQRRTVEAKTAVTPGRMVDRPVEPAKEKAPRSPITAKPAAQRGKNQIPPRVPQAPRPEARVQPKAEAPDRQSSADRRPPAAETREAGPRPDPAPAKVRAESPRQEPPAPARAQPDNERRTRDANAKSEAAEKSQQRAESRANESAAKERDDAQRHEQQARQRADESASRSRQQADERGKAVKVPEEPKRPDQPTQAKARQDSAPHAKDAKPAPKDKPAAKGKPVEDDEEEKKEKEKKDKEKPRGG